MLKRLFNRTPKTHQVYVEPFGTTLTVGAKETILKAALRAGIAYPYECMTGGCATCKTQLLEGEIKPLVDFAYVLDMEEMRGGTILACQSLAKTDLKLRIDTLDDGMPAIAPETIEGTIESIEKLTRDIVEVRIKLARGIDYYAGQYANLTVPEINATRAYSFASAPRCGGQTELSFHIRVIPNGEMSGWIAADDRTGSAITVDGPYGIFRYRESEAPIVCIAGGSGMAPIKALLEHAGQGGVNRPVVYLYGGRTQADLYSEAVINDLTRAWAGPLRFVPVLSEEPESSNWSGARGMVSEFIKTIDDFDLAGCQAYLCGPPPMIDAAIPILTNAGVRGRDIYFDKFTDRSDTANQ